MTTVGCHRRGAKLRNESSSISAIAAPLRPFGPRRFGAMTYAYGSPGADGFFLSNRLKNSIIEFSRDCLRSLPSITFSFVYLRDLRGSAILAVAIQITNPQTPSDQMAANPPPSRQLLHIAPASRARDRLPQQHRPSRFHPALSERFPS